MGPSGSGDGGGGMVGEVGLYSLAAMRGVMGNGILYYGGDGGGGGGGGEGRNAISIIDHVPVLGHINALWCAFP